MVITSQRAGQLVITNQRKRRMAITYQMDGQLLVMTNHREGFLMIITTQRARVWHGNGKSERGAVDDDGSEKSPDAAVEGKKNHFVRPVMIVKIT